MIPHRRFVPQLLVLTLLVAVQVPAPPAPAAAGRPDWAFSPAPALLPCPEGLRPAVGFWKAIFSRYSRDQTILHDAEHVEIVYEVVNTSGTRSERERVQRVKAAIKHHRDLLRDLVRKPPEHRTAEERRIARRFAQVPGASLDGAAYRVRAQRGLRERFRRGLVRAGRWQAMMIEVFRSYGVPPQITVLPHVESSFNPEAHSRAGAVGIWQFTRSTGRRYLRIGYDIDERRDVLAATHAAARHLRDNYRDLHSWPLAIIAYNHGAAGMRRAVEQLGTRNVETIIADYRSRTFRFASRNFYPEFLAALEIAWDPELYFGPLSYERPLPLETFVLPAYATASAVSQALRVSPSELRVLNPALGRTFWTDRQPLPKGYTLKIPAGTVDDLHGAFAGIPRDQRWDEAPQPPAYRVRWGDTLSAISHRFGIRLRDLKAVNDLRGDRIYAGQTLYLPVDPASR
ncbi:MAG: transglycosylase SLT domain-containing protein [Candidatus Eisenbacteria bacterium]|nr:transglycosylase SLT domain-containing protein [Candidatus Eisenbacteria bacterium]